MDLYREQAVLLKLLAHPLRLQILDILRGGNECVCHLSAALNKPQPYISQQLAILRNGGAILDEREGTNIFYRLANTNVLRLVEAACGPASIPTILEPGSRRRAVAGCNCPKCANLTSDHG